MGVEACIDCELRRFHTSVTGVGAVDLSMDAQRWLECYQDQMMLAKWIKLRDWRVIGIELCEDTGSRWLAMVAKWEVQLGSELLCSG